MHDSEITKAAVTLLQQIEKTSQPANEIINAYVRARRYIGSKDRRKMTDLVWEALRHTARLNISFPKASWDEKLASLSTLPDIIPGAPDWVNWEVPEWLPDMMDNPAEELPALMQPAVIVLRANGDRNKIQKMLANEGLETTLTPLSPHGLILHKRTNLTISPTYRDGLVEVQDEGSQLVALATEIHSGETVLDYCAGAGGKSLIFAQMMQGKGKIIAHDISDKSLWELQKRAERAKIKIIETTRTPKGVFDHVVVDAPCSGTGTWRRNPDARWNLTSQQVSKLIKTQADILDEATAFVAPNGKISYITCSLLRAENGDPVTAFLKKHPDFQLIKQKQFSPYRTNTDGLFIATMQRQN